MNLHTLNLPEKFFHMDAPKVYGTFLEIITQPLFLSLLRWDNDTLRFSDKNQKAIDMLRTKCLKLKSLVLCDGRLYEIMRGNFERADRRSVIRTGVNCRVSTHYLLTYYEELLFT